jgi:hypothetical protein
MATRSALRFADLLAFAGWFTDEAAPIRTPYRALAVSTGRDQTCVVLDDHRAKCWGQNTSGQLGLGDTRWRGSAASEMGDALPAIELGTGRTVTAISAGRYHTCAILDDGAVECWGHRAFCGGPPGAANPYIGDEPGEMGDALGCTPRASASRARTSASSAARAASSRTVPFGATGPSSSARRVNIEGPTG